MKVNPSIEESLVPMFAEDEEALREAKRKRDEHWMRMRNARKEWLESIADEHSTELDKFWDQWLPEVCGFRPHRDNHGNITASYDIVDEKKYTVFLLKFGQ